MNLSRTRVMRLAYDASGPESGRASVARPRVCNGDGMTVQRDLRWDGMENVRDLGGLTTLDGRSTTWGAVVRSDHPSKLTAVGWQALFDHEIRTIVTLTTAGIDPLEVDYGLGPPAAVDVVRIDIEDGTDPEFGVAMMDTGFWATPFAFVDALERWPERCVAVVQAVATAPPGGVLVHCSRGCDRTGLAALLMLDLVGVASADIAADYAISAGAPADDRPRPCRLARCRARRTRHDHRRGHRRDPHGSRCRSRTAGRRPARRRSGRAARAPAGTLRPAVQSEAGWTVPRTVSQRSSAGASGSPAAKRRVSPETRSTATDT